MAKKDTPLRLLTSVPNKDYSRLIVRYPYQTDSQYAHAYHAAAKRLATTFGGEPIDDLLLLPFLTLYRQAFELQLKNTIRSLVGLRIKHIEGRTPELLQVTSEKYFKGNLGHNLHKLLNEVKKHLSNLAITQEFPGSVEAVVLKLHEADRTGTAFRYAGRLPETQEYADFPDLAEMLDSKFLLLCAVTDDAEAIYDAAPTLDEVASDCY